LTICADAFFVKLQALLQHEGSDTWQAESIDRGANELGIDSLISVDLRTWFLKELDVDMPALKILGGASIREMLEYALEKLPRDMMPRLSSDSHVAKNKAVAAEVPAMKEIVEAERPQETQSSSASGSAEDERSTDSSAKSQTSEVTPANLSDVEESGEFAHKLSQVVRTEELSFGQARFWTLMSLMKNPTALNIGCLVKLTGDLRISDLERAMHTVGQRHEALRTRFFTDEDDRTWQGVLGESTISFEKKDISTEALAFQEFEEIKQTLFDLESGQVMRVVLLSLSPSCNYLIILYHHIALDGVSLEIFLADLQQSYNGKPLATKVLQYPEYSKKQRQAAITGLFDPELEFWKKELAHIPPPLPLLPFSNASVRQVLSDYDFNSVDYRVDRALTTRIKMACQKHRATPFHFYFATLSILISRLLSIDEFCIGTADANRMDIETMTSVGNYLNLLPIRLTPKRSQAFAEAMQEVREKAFAALANSKIPFDLLLEKLHFQRSALHSPIFQAFINYRQGVRETRMFGDAKAEAQAYLIAKTGYDISLDIIDNPGGDSTISFMVQKGLYSEKDAASLMSMYVRLLDAFSKKPTANINLPSLHSKEDLDKVLQLGRGKPTAKPEYPTVIQRVDHMIEEHPTRAALRDSTGLQYSYDQMARRVNALASRLIAIGFASQSRIAVLQEPSIDWVCCMLAIMRIGATYVPLDTRLPTLRLETIAQDCSPAAILVHNPTIEAASKLGLADTQIVNASDIAQSFGEKMPNQASPEDVAAILYTSGSTGEPKGILLGHEGIANEIEDSAETFELGPEDKVLQQSAVSFDMSIWQTFNALGNGGMLYVVSKQHRIDPVSISSIIGKEGISVTNGTPSEYLCWLRDGLVDDLKNSSWRLAVAGGEQVTQTHMKEFSALGKRGLQFFNGYGPTEVTIVSSKANLDYSELAEVSCDENYPVGHTTRNCSVYIVDSSLQLLPACHSGEILVGGPGVAHGYLNERLTKEKFMPDTFASQDQVSRGWMKMYKTGDRGYLRPDGALVVESRIVGDTEIKLRGIRIDVQDVEKAIVRASKGAILRAIVSVRGDPQFLVAHVVLGPQVPKEELRAFWLTLVGTLPLPQYMCPALALSLDELPLTGHGKVDRQAISALPLDEELGSKPKEQWNDEDLPEVQSRLRNLWVELLPNGKSQKKAIGPESDFFYSGGNSGLLVRLQRAIREHFDVIIPLAELFEASTLRQMGVYVENHTTHSHIDWDIETSFDRDTIAQEASRLLELVSPSNSKSEGKVIMLTGATGNLGSSVLPLLSQRTDVAKIHCVAVRDLGKLEEIEKIVVHPGDLTKSRLGLGEVEFATLAANVDVIIHCGAARSFWDYYHTLRNVNVSSAKELVLLAAGRKIPIHFLSSGGAAAIGRDSAKPLESLKDIQPQTDGSDGYVSSKWAAEQIFESAAERFGIPVAIYRTLPADAQKATAAQKVAALETFMEFSKLLSSLPSDDGWEGKMDLLPLKNFAEAIVANATSVERGATDNTIATYSNHEASIQVDMEELAAYVEANLDAKSLGEFERVQAIEWVGMAKKAGFPLMFASQSLTFTAPGAKKGLELRR
jgi:hybrid polyketide synthase/nonribosomal peptide synthetase ACE1